MNIKLIYELLLVLFLICCILFLYTIKGNTNKINIRWEIIGLTDN